MITNSKVRHFFIFSLVLTQIFSSVLFFPGIESYGGSIFRVLLTALGIILIISVGFQKVSSSVRRVLIAGLILLIWMTVSLNWTDNISQGVRQILYMLTIVMLIYVLEVLVVNIKDFYFLCLSIVIVCLGVMAFSAYELETGVHFFNSQLLDVSQSDASLSYIVYDTAWFTFGNPNDLGSHLIMCCFISLLLMRNDSSFILILFFVAIGLYLSYRVEARLALLAFGVFGFIYVICLVQKSSAKNLATAIVASMIGALVVVSALLYADLSEFVDASTFVRLKLLASAISMSAQSFMVGIGAGSFENEMWLGGWTAMTYGIVNPHNAMGRILAENGVIGFLVFAFMMFGPLGALTRSGAATRLSAFVAGFATALPLLLSVASDPLSASSLQLAIAFGWISSRLARVSGQNVLPSRNVLDAETGRLSIA